MPGLLPSVPLLSPINVEARMPPEMRAFRMIVADHIHGARPEPRFAAVVAWRYRAS